RKVKDALTGRIELITLWPLAQGEVHGTGGIIDGLFAGRPPMVQDAPVGHQAFLAPLAAGGYPEAMSRDDRRRGRWFRSYLETLLDRELRDLSDAQKLQEVPHLLRLVAAQSSGILNYQTIANRLQLNEKTVKAYLELLETAFITCRLPAWRPGLAAREVHAPKLHLVDTGLLLHVIGADEARLGQDPQVTGMALENFVAMEIVKQLVPAQVEATAYHYRFGRSEVDIVLESTAGDIVGIEVKASATPSHQDRLGLEKVRELAGDRFKLGMIVYTGRQTLPLGDRLWAVPVSGLWS
ncbi:MAG: DUF4143 domain-containing protein, partial [Bifidobacteriaceae bacterium]|nr:DUF4143 domain-containing protein [Bifidobacteriaceae bacterium]